jgi:ribonuclease R
LAFPPESKELKKKQNHKPHSALTKEIVLETLAREPNATKRDLGRILGVHGNERVTLKRILKELETEGEISRGRKRSFAKAGHPVRVVAISKGRGNFLGPFFLHCTGCHLGGPHSRAMTSHRKSKF